MIVKFISVLMIGHCAIVSVILFAPKTFFIHLAINEDLEYTIGLLTSLAWYVGLNLIMLGIITNPNKLGYDTVLKKEIWGEYYQDIGVQSQIDKNKGVYK